MERRSSKSKLEKQDEFEEVEEEPYDSPPEVLITEPGQPFSKSDETLDQSQPDISDESPETTDKQSDRPKQETIHSHPKVKLLVRSQAVRDDTSPPPDTDSSTLTTPSSQQNKSPRQKLEKHGSSKSSLDASSPSLSRDSSTEAYTDSTGIDLQEFIIMTLHKNQKDRLLLLRIEQDLHNLIKDSRRQYIKFPQMSSYQRMLVHRVAAFFGMEHNVDQSGTAVMVNKTKTTRVPDMKFRDHIRDEMLPDEPKKSILKRESASFEEGKEPKSPERQGSLENKRSKSFEEREEEYEKARARIFNQDSSSSQEGVVDSPIRSRESTRNSSRRSSQEDLSATRWVSEPRPWSSTDSDSSNRPIKPAVTKASSFGGISVLMRGDSSSSSKSGRLSKADSLGSNPGSGNIVSIPSITKTQPTPPSSLPSITTPQTTTQTTTTASSNPFPSYQVFPGQVTSTSQVTWAVPSEVVTPGIAPPTIPATTGGTQGHQVMWAVSNMDQVPPGSILINPQTGQPYYNSDGTVYRYNPGTSAPSVNPSTPSQSLSSQQPVVAQPPNITPVYPQFLQQPLSTTTDQRSYSTDTSGNELASAFSSITLTPQSSAESIELPGSQRPQQQQFIVPGIRAVGYSSNPPPAATPQATSLTQVPVYFVPPSQPIGSGQSPRYVYPAPFVPSPPQQTQMQPQTSLTSNQTQSQQPGYSTPSYYPTPAPVTGPPFQQHLHSQLPDSYCQYYSTPSSLPPNSATVQGFSYPHPVSSTETSQTNTYMPSNVPIFYTMPTSSTSPGVSTFGPAGTAIRSQTPPGQSTLTHGTQGVAMTTTGQPISISQALTQGNLSYLPYPAYHPTPSQPQTPTTQYAGFSTTFVPSFPLFRPNMPMMQMRSTTPPPHTTQFQAVPLAAQHKLYSMDQRLQKMELYNPDGSGIAAYTFGDAQKNQPLPSGPHLGSLTIRSSPAPNAYNRSPLIQGDMRFIGQPLQQQFQPPLRAPIVLPQPRARLQGPLSQISSKPPKARKQRNKNTSGGTSKSVNECANSSLQTSLDFADKQRILSGTTSNRRTATGSYILEVKDLPPGISRQAAEQLLGDLTNQGARLQFLRDDGTPEASGTDFVLTSKTKVVAIFSSETAAQSSLAYCKNVKYKLGMTQKPLDLQSLC